MRTATGPMPDSALIRCATRHFAFRSVPPPTIRSTALDVKPCRASVRRNGCAVSNHVVWLNSHVRAGNDGSEVFVVVMCHRFEVWSSLHCPSALQEFTGMLYGVASSVVTNGAI